MNYSRRILVFSYIIYFLAGLLILKLFHVQVAQGGRYRRQSENNHIRLIPTAAPRGQIFDRNGKALATNRPAYHVYMTPEDFNPADLNKLSKLLEIPVSEIRKRVGSPRFRSMTPVMIKRDVSKEMAMRIEERKPSLSGVFIQIEGVRFYPHRNVNGHTLGYIGKITREEYQKSDRDIFRMDSSLGRAGIEKSFDNILRGEDGGKQIQVNARGEQIGILSERNPVAGENLSLSLDVEMEEKILPALAGKRASVLMMDLETGELLVLMSYPDFDPNIFVEGNKDRERIRLLKDPARPLVNRALLGAYPSGSVFKLVTALAGLETGKVTRYSTFQCNGFFRLTPNSRKFKCWEPEGHGSVDLSKALERSCNVYFYNVGRIVGEKNLEHFAKVLGLGETLPLEIPNAEGLIPSAEWKQAKLHDNWYLGETISFSIGQGYVLTTPLQILRLVSLIAKNGEAPMPTLLKVNKDSVIPKYQTNVHPESFRIIKQGMLQVTESKYGTGQLARIDFMKVAAKTGTAQAPPNNPHAWFVGFFPYESPKYGLVVFVEHGGSGGLAAAKIAKHVLATWHELYTKNTVFDKPALPPINLEIPG